MKTSERSRYAPKFSSRLRRRKRDEERRRDDNLNYFNEMEEVKCRTNTTPVSSC